MYKIDRFGRNVNLFLGSSYLFEVKTCIIVKAIYMQDIYVSWFF